MKRNKAKEIIIPGILCMIFLAASIWYSVRYNESRLIVPTDLETYQFSPKDIPMICSIILTIVYGYYLLVCLGKTSIQQKKNILKTNRTRKLNAKLGFLGFFGFLGFIGGGWFRFVFFGFFGFFYEGKMSNTLMDERFRENKKKAQLMALKAAFAVIIFAFILILIGESFMSIESLFTVIYILISLSIALAIFLSEYLLYRYDHNEYSNDEHINGKYVDKNEYYIEDDMKES
ncbi:MAG: DUF3796 domain-containing protein [Lachnospiraceae bacterium]|nr:DUF3796 domain-containing protein [Lachnospiraceae bacterium]